METQKMFSIWYIKLMIHHANQLHNQSGSMLYDQNFKNIHNTIIVINVFRLFTQLHIQSERAGKSDFLVKMSTSRKSPE